MLRYYPYHPTGYSYDWNDAFRDQLIHGPATAPIATRALRYGLVPYRLVGLGCVHSVHAPANDRDRGGLTGNFQGGLSTQPSLFRICKILTDIGILPSYRCSLPVFEEPQGAHSMAFLR
jgi:hypothetical protein